MSEIIKRNAGALGEWDPIQTMRELMRWDPFREMAPMIAPMSATFDRDVWNPSFEVRENKEGYQFKADVPGVKKEDLDISITGNRLQIKGKREFEQENKGDTFYTYERAYGSFARSFTLPEGADFAHARSDLKEGVLTLVVPKKVEAQPQKIAIGPGAVKS